MALLCEPPQLPGSQGDVKRELLFQRWGDGFGLGRGASWHLGLFALAYLESRVLCLGEFSPQILSCQNKDICILVINVALALPALS